MKLNLLILILLNYKINGAKNTIANAFELGVFIGFGDLCAFTINSPIC